jgi:HNH endonuclease/NUMOD4 motif/AP2 domain
MEEVWKPVPGFDGYEASNKGRIRSIKILKPYSNIKNNGYKMVNFSMGKSKKKQFCVHRIVAETFIGPADKKNVVDHINGIRTDNNVENLRFCSHRENLSFSNRKNFNTIKSKYVGVTWHQKKWRAQIYHNGKNKYLGSYKTEEEAYNAYKEFAKNNGIITRC